ncbi:transposase [Rhodoferax ferrireducens]|uniref:transposase n=1 Tax=Rhodoferax ferrireducens TaxID=192843 RepID=UPI000E0D16D0
MHKRHGYDAALRARGSLTSWITAEAIDHWVVQPRSTRRGQGFYLDFAIKTNQMLRLVFRRPLCKTQGLMGSIFTSIFA